MIVYAAVMCLLFPIGVPLYYAAALFRSRNELREIRRLELKNSAAFTAIKLRAAELAPEEASKFMERAEQANEASTEKYKKLRRELPSTLRKLTAGYEMRCFWFEIFECVRKILLVGLPVFFEPGTPGQLILGLVIAFLTFGAYCAFAPYENRSDDVLSAVCQVAIFISLVASIVTNAFPNDPAMSVLLPALLFLPPALSMLFEIKFFEFLSSMLSAEEGKRPGWLGQPLQSCRNACVNRLDRLLGTPELRSSLWHHYRVHPPDGTFPEEQEVPPASLKRDNLLVAMRGAGARNLPSSLLFWLRSTSSRKPSHMRAKVKEADATVGQGGASAAAIAPIEYSLAALPAVESQTATRSEKPVESAPAGRTEEPSQPQESRKLHPEMGVADLGMEVEDLDSG